jgi:hypothetical protein
VRKKASIEPSGARTRAMRQHSQLSSTIFLSVAKCAPRSVDHV